jgi:tRNA (guanine-N7-)-methyltransferase
MSSPQIRTFQVQRSRLGIRRREALTRLGPRYTIGTAGEPLDPVAVFGRQAPLVLEIGSGMGHATAQMAANDPDRDYLAAEVHDPGVANLLLLIEQQQLTNLRIAHGDALELLQQRIRPDSLDAVLAFFPDPWPKLRHHKRRLFQPAHVALMRSRLRPGGLLHTATDWAHYAKVMHRTLTADPELVNVYPDWAPRQPQRPLTKYEQRAVAEGRSIFELVFRRTH